jgi:hypothetical protein
MKEILHNMALDLLTRFCVNHGHDCSNTYVIKDGRGFTYSLRDGTTGEFRGARITFHKSSVPTYQIISTAMMLK